MANYRLLDQTICFSDSAERYYDTIDLLSEARIFILKEFSKWYDDCNDIATVLQNCDKKSDALITHYGIEPLCRNLLKYGVYDINSNSFRAKYLDLTRTYSVLDTLIDKYNVILETQQAEEEYRALRKATRDRVVGGGFGVIDSLKGMAAAGTMNALSGLGHSVVNTVGNIGSAISAASSKKELYNASSTRSALIEAIQHDLAVCFDEYIRLLNERYSGFIRDEFDGEKAAAYLENAISLPSKERELLIESFKNCPWDSTLLEYIFTHYKDERKNVWTIAERFDVSLEDTAEQVFADSYTDEAKVSEDLSQIVKTDILAQMKELGITHSATIDTIELDGLRRIAYSILGADDEIRKSKLELFTDYNASTKNKRIIAHECKLWELAPVYSISFSIAEVDEILNMYIPDSILSEEEVQKIRPKLLTIMEKTGTSQSSVLDKLENSRLERLCADLSNANETECNQLITKINAYPAMDKNKEPFLERVQNRITDIWSKQDAGAFDNLFLSTNLLDPADVQKTKALIQQQDRTNASTDYIKALNICTHDNIQRAKKYQTTSAKFYLYAGIALEFIGFFVAYITYDAFLVEYLFIAAGFLLVGYYLWMRKIYNTLTFKKKLIHSQLSIQTPLSTVNPAYQTYKPYVAKPVPPASPVPPAGSTGSTKPGSTTSTANSAMNNSSVNNHQ